MNVTPAIPEGDDRGTLVKPRCYVPAVFAYIRIEEVSCYSTSVFMSAPMNSPPLIVRSMTEICVMALR